MGECFVRSRFGSVYRLPILDESYPKDVAVTVVNGQQQSATFEARIASDGIPAEYAFQWYVDGVAVDGATNSSFTKNDISEAAVQGVYCEITSKAGLAVTRVATLNVTQNDVPVLDSRYPADLTVNVGDGYGAEVKIIAHGNPAEYTYRWYIDDKVVSGATGEKLTVTQGVAKGAYKVYCEVSNAAGTVRSRVATITASRFYLFKAGTGFASGYTGVVNGSHSRNQITMTIKVMESGDFAYIREPIDVTSFSKVVFEGVTASWSGTGAYSHVIAIGVGEASAEIGRGNGDDYPNHVMCNNRTYTMDLRMFNGLKQVLGYYSCSDDDASTATITIRNIYFE